jgi:hypothetical protein
MGAADQAWREFEREHPERLDYAERADNCARWAAYYSGFPQEGMREAATARVWERVQQGVDHRVARADEMLRQCELVRDIFGNPFLPMQTIPAWQTPDVVTLAGHIYYDRAFERLKELADVLEDVGCQNENLVNHCRQHTEHARGCWVVDFLLGKS